MESIRKQTPQQPENWLFQEQEENTRVFAKFVFLGINAKEWLECTNEEKMLWEVEHPKDDIYERDAETN